jgi:hypothetical protein
MSVPRAGFCTRPGDAEINDELVEQLRLALELELQHPA